MELESLASGVPRGLAPVGPDAGGEGNEGSDAVDMIILNMPLPLYPTLWFVVGRVCDKLMGRAAVDTIKSVVSGSKFMLIICSGNQQRWWSSRELFRMIRWVRLLLNNVSEV